MDNIYVDPTFQIGSSSTMEKYVAKPAPPPSGFVNFVSTVVSHTTEVFHTNLYLYFKNIYHLCSYGTMTLMQ